MVTMTTSEARKDLAGIVRRVREGEEVILSRHDKPAAAIIGIAGLRRYLAWKKRDALAADRGAGLLERLQAETREVIRDIADAEAALAEDRWISLEDLMAELD